MKDILKFEAEYDGSHEDKARQTRGVFLDKFPVGSLSRLTVEDDFAEICQAARKPINFVDDNDIHLLGFNIC
jgi:hypothetical protein